MEQLQAGHDAALNDLMERHATLVFHLFCRMVGNEADANDLAQETFVRVFKSRASFRTEQKFSTWLFTIAANLARNHFRWRLAASETFRWMRKITETEQTLGSTFAGKFAHAERSRAGRRTAAAVRAAVKNLPRRFTRGGCFVRMGGMQRGRGRCDSGNVRRRPWNQGFIAPASFCASG